MATIKKRVLALTSGKTIKLSGHSLCISSTLEIGEGFTKNVLGINESYKKGGTQDQVLNPYTLTKDEIYEIADYNIFLWMELKGKIRQFNLESINIFKKPT